MKKRILTLAAALVLASLLAGCAAPSAPETLAVETQTAAQTQAPTQATQPQAAQAPTSVPTEPPTTTSAQGEGPAAEVPNVITQPQTTVNVSTPDEFLAAVGPNVEIVVAAGELDWSQATGYGTGSGEHYYWRETFDGTELVITDVRNLTIRGSGETHEETVLSAVPRYANVLNFESCSNILVTGLTAGHTREPGACVGGVLAFENCQDVVVADCGLFGCGTLGVWGASTKNLTVVNSEIYECSVGGVEFVNCQDVQVVATTFRDLGGPEFRVYQSENITWDGEIVEGFN